jgi:hypothetical protein
MTTPRTLQADQVSWYRKHGRFPLERITKDSKGNEFVVGDVSWNLNNHQACRACKRPYPNEPNRYEVIEDRMELCQQ